MRGLLWGTEVRDAQDRLLLGSMEIINTFKKMALKNHINMFRDTCLGGHYGKKGNSAKERFTGVSVLIK